MHGKFKNKIIFWYEKVFHYFIVRFSIYRADTQIVISPDTACIHVDTNGIIDTVKLTITNNTAAEVSLYWTLDLGKTFHLSGEPRFVISTYAMITM